MTGFVPIRKPAKLPPPAALGPCTHPARACIQSTRAAAATLAALSPLPAHASSHREAPFITTVPNLDATDLYLFNSYEAGRTGNVTVIANYLPLQGPYGGSNYFKLDPNALYKIHIANNGDAISLPEQAVLPYLLPLGFHGNFTAA